MSVLTAYERYFFDLNGYIVRTGILGATEVAALRSAVGRLKVPAPGPSIQSQRFAGFLEHSSEFRQLLDHEAVIDVVQELCGPHVRLDHAYGIVMAQGTSGLDLHGNAVPFDPCQYYLVRGNSIACGLVAAQWALSDAMPGDGGFCCIPGSHKAAFPRPTDLDMDDPMVQEIPLAAGSVVIFSEALCHGTLPWRAVHDRLTLLYKYSPGNSSWGNEPRLSPALAAHLTERQRRLLEHPYVGGRHPT
ncbi:MAG: phytanoyl-CoA dioxygenase family protein [Acidimicrobiia bacterium]